MKTLITSFILAIFSISASAQLISRFTWETNPPTTAVYGPNALSVSSFATVSTGGTTGTKGLNPGAGSNDINLVLDGSNYNVPAIDIAIDFRREESVASFFYRGTYFSFGMNNGSLVASFQLTGAVTPTTITSGNIYTIPDDHTFHNYRFNYDNNTGIAKVWVDAVVVYTYTGTAGIALYWTGAGNITIGKDMDGTGRNVAVLDNLVIQKYANALLPVKLLSFTAEQKYKLAFISFNTTEEINVTAFTIERSSNGAIFSAIANIVAQNGYNVTNQYSFTDSMPLGPIAYYRLKMLNGDGTFTYSAIKTVSFETGVSASMSVYPNPSVDYVNIKMTNARAAQFHYTVTTISGQVISAADVQLSSGVQQIKIDLTKTAVKGMMVIQLINTQTNTSKTFTIIKA